MSAAKLKLALIADRIDTPKVDHASFHCYGVYMVFGAELNGRNSTQFSSKKAP
jgi:hypothetical protein